MPVTDEFSLAKLKKLCKFIYYPQFSYIISINYILLNFLNCQISYIFKTKWLIYFSSKKEELKRECVNLLSNFLSVILRSLKRERVKKEIMTGLVD